MWYLQASRYLAVSISALTNKGNSSFSYTKGNCCQRQADIRIHSKSLGASAEEQLVTTAQTQL